MYRITYKQGTELQVSDFVETSNSKLLVVSSIKNHIIRFRTTEELVIEDSFGFTVNSFYNVLDFSVLKEKQLWLWEQEEAEQEFNDLMKHNS